MFHLDDDEPSEAYIARITENRAKFTRKQLLKTSYGRFHDRIANFRKNKTSVLIHHFWWFIHNCIAHPAIGLLPIKPTFRFHDWTSDKINLK